SGFPAEPPSLSRQVAASPLSRRDERKGVTMRKMLLVAMFVGVVGLLSAAPALAADYPPSCDNTATSPSSGVGSQTCGTTNANGDPTLYVAGASGDGALAFTGSNPPGPL